jgi:hypothetical protein
LDIPHHKRKEIIYTKVVCEIREGRDDENCTRITVGGNLIYTPIVDPKYICIKITDIPKEFILEYGLAREWIYFEIRCGCYGLPQAGILANNLLCG